MCKLNSKRKIVIRRKFEIEIDKLIDFKNLIVKCKLEISHLKLNYWILIVDWNS